MTLLPTSRGMLDAPHPNGLAIFIPYSRGCKVRKRTTIEQHSRQPHPMLGKDVSGQLTILENGAHEGLGTLGTKIQFQPPIGQFGASSSVGSCRCRRTAFSLPASCLEA